MNKSVILKKRILILHDAPLSEWKGTQRILMEYANYLARNGFEVIYASPKKFERPEGESQIQFNNDIKFCVKAMGMKHFLIYFVSRRELKLLKPDLIIVSTFNVFPFIPFNRYRVIMGSHVYGPEHEKLGSRYNKFKIKMKRVVFKIISLFYSKTNVAFYGINPTQEKWLTQLLPKKFTVYLQPPPLDCRPFNVVEFHNLPNKFTVLYFGELTYDKGFFDFTKIVKKFEEETIYKNIEFIIGTVGGPLMKDAQSLCSQFKNVTLIKTEKENAKINTYQMSSLLISPSKVENFHIVSLEAQLCGLPVISSDISGPKSIIENNVTGILVPVGDIDGFYQALIGYYNIWSKDKLRYYHSMKINSQKVRRFCKENILPQFLEMVNNELKK